MPCSSMGPNNFGRVLIVLGVRFGQVQITKISPEKSNLNLSPDENDVDPIKMIWT